MIFVISLTLPAAVVALKRGWIIISALIFLFYDILLRPVSDMNKNPVLNAPPPPHTHTTRTHTYPFFLFLYFYIFFISKICWTLCKCSPLRKTTTSFGYSQKIESFTLFPMSILSTMILMRAMCMEPKQALASVNSKEMKNNHSPYYVHSHFIYSPAC